MIYPCENIYLRAIDQPIDERIVKRALIALGTICNSDIAKSIYNANIENLFSINDRIYEMASSIFSKCIGRSELLNIIKKPETNGCSELREGMLIRAIGENNILDAIPYVIWKLRSSRSILVLRDSIRSLGLLGYKDAFKDSIEAMRKRGLRLEDKMDIEMVMSLVRIKTEGMRMKRYIFRRHDIFSRIDMQYGGRLIDALADTYTRNVIGYHSSPSVNMVSMSTKKGKKYIIIFENRSQCYLEPGKYYYTERVYVNGKEYDPYYYTIFDILMPPYYRPFQLVYWETYIPKELISAGDEVKVSICNYKYFSKVIRIR